MRIPRPILPATVAVFAAAAVIIPAAVGHGGAPAAQSGPVHAWLTTDDSSQELSPQPDLQLTTGDSSDGQNIAVDEARTFQTITGFGATFTDSSAYLMQNKLDQSLRGDVMSKLFDPANPDGIHLSILRQPAGATDFIKDVHGYYTYDDLPAGQTDPELKHFSISHDDAYLVPVLRDALQHNPALKVMLTSWSPPAWMKTTGSTVHGGTLKPQFYRAYANYLVKAIQAYQQRGIPIWSTSAQNEPSSNTPTYPSMNLSSTQEATLVQKYFRPALDAAGLKPLLFAGDDVCFNAGYPAGVLDHPGATTAFDAVSMHGYCGDYQAMTTMHALHPDLDIYQTELSPGCQSQNPSQLIIGAMRNWARSAITWNVALDPRGGPMHLGDSSKCVPLVTIGDDGKPSYNLAYYREGQASRFVRPGAVRIASTGDGPVEHVAFRNPDGGKVLMAYNSGTAEQKFTVHWGDRNFSYTLPSKGTVTFTWNGTTTSTYGWGASTFGTDADAPFAGGLQTGDWDLHSATAADSTSLGNGWNSTYLGYADLRDFTVRADVRPLTRGTTTGAPKYGIYACYRDSDNYVQGWFDPGNHYFVTHAMVSGMDLGWTNTTLDPGFDFTAQHRIEARRTGTSVTFLVDGKVVVNSVAPATNCQIGLVTQDYTAQFHNVSVTRR